MQDWKPSDAWQQLYHIWEVDYANLQADAAGAEDSGACTALWTPASILVLYINRLGSNKFVLHIYMCVLRQSNKHLSCPVKV